MIPSSPSRTQMELYVFSLPRRDCVDCRGALFGRLGPGWGSLPGKSVGEPNRRTQRAMV